MHVLHLWFCTVSAEAVYCLPSNSSALPFRIATSAVASVATVSYVLLTNKTIDDSTEPWLELYREVLGNCHF